MSNFGFHIARWSAVILLIAAFRASAQDSKITLGVEPAVIRLNETATLKLTFINLTPPQAPAPPQIPDFNTDYIGQENKFENANGKRSTRVTYNYRLAPTRTGNFSIGPFTMNLNGETTVLEGAKLEVLPVADSSGSANQTMNELVFARVVLPRNEVYIQERFDVELLLYYRGVQLDRGIQLQNLPSVGLNLDSFEEVGSSREVVNNEIYQVRRFRMRGIAISSGFIELRPMVRVNVLVQGERSRDPFFGGFIRMQETEPLSVATDPINVSILPLPSENKPALFSGAVGKFNMGVDVQPLECSAGDPVTLTLRITGNGNFETISMPPLSFGTDFRAYDPKLVAAGADHKVFEQVFIPRSDKITEIPPVTFTYFDPEAAQYKTVTHGPIALVVKPGTAGAQQMVQAPSALPASVKDPLGIDIIDVKRSAPDWKTRQATGMPELSSLAVHALPVFAIAFFTVFRKQRAALHRDVSRRRRSLAPRSARAAIKKAEEALKEKNTSGFYEAVWQAMADYVGHRANLEPGEVSPQLILKQTEKGGLDEAKRKNLKTILDACDASRFASINNQNENDLKDILNQIQDILRACEQISI